MRYRIACAALAAVALVSPRVHAGDDDSKVDPAYEKKILGEAERIQKAVEKIRGLKYQAPVKKGVQTEAVLKKQLAAEFQKPENKADVEKEGRVAKAFGLVPQDFKWAEEQATLLGEQIAGFYDNEGKKLRLVEKKSLTMSQDMQDANDETVMAHELEHALQDQNFDLGRWFALVEGNLDRTAAYKSVVEGEATFIMFRYMFDKQGMPMMDMKTLWGMNKGMADMVPGAKEQQEKLEKLPPYLVGNLMMSYEDGSVFVQQVYDKGGWDAVTKLFQDPPTSTQQILHPKMYFDRVEPADIAMPSIAKAIKGKALDQSTLGEYNIRLLLEAHGVKKKASKKLAAGWHGDVFQAVELESGKIALAWLTTWRDEDAAKAFEEAYREGLTKRVGEAFTLERRGSEVLLADCADASVREKMMKKAWFSAVQDGHLKPFPSMLGKPPVKDFTEVEEDKGFGLGDSSGAKSGAKSVALGERVNDEEVGYSFRVAAEWKKQDADTIKELKDFSRGMWKTNGGGELRILDLPMPFDKDNLIQQFETLVRKGTKEFKKQSQSTSMRGGHDALEVQFEGIIPDGTNTKIEARAIAVERDQMTLIFMLTAPKGKLAADLPALDAALATLKFAGHALADEKEFKHHHLVLATSGAWKARALDSDRLELEGPDGKGLIRAVAARATSDDIGAESKATEALRAKFLDRYRLLGSSTIEHEHLGSVYVSDFEFKTKEGETRRARELVALSKGERLSVTCSTDPESFEKLRPAFERAIATFHVAHDGKGPEPKHEPKSEPKKDPGDKDEPF